MFKGTTSNVSTSYYSGLTSKREISIYFLVVFIVYFTTSTFFMGANRWIVTFLPISLYLVNARIGYLADRKILLLLGVVWLLSLFQVMKFGNISPAFFYRPILEFYAPFLVFTALGIRFYRYFLGVLKVVIVYTTIIYLLQTFLSPVDAYIRQMLIRVFPYSWADWPRTLLIYSTTRESGFFFERSSGIFHEPGAFALNLILAITLNTIIQKSFVNKWNIFMSAVVITTFSTAGYIALASYWGYAIIRARINFLITGILFTVFIVASLFVYQTQEFLGEKIDEHLYVQSEYVKEGETMGRGRIFAAGISARIALQNAFFGRGAITAVQEEGVYGYGLFDIFRRFGIIFGILYTFWFYRGLRRIADYYNYKKGVLALMIPLNLALASQAYNFYMPFILMVIIGLYNGRLNPREM